MFDHYNYYCTLEVLYKCQHLCTLAQLHIDSAERPENPAQKYFVPSVTAGLTTVDRIHIRSTSNLIVPLMHVPHVLVHPR